MRRHSVRPANCSPTARKRDEGSVLILALVVILIGSMIVLPMMTYTMSVLRANKVTSGRNVKIEAVKGGLRAALFDPTKLYKACIGSGATTAHQLNMPPGLGIETQCTTTSSRQQVDLPDDLRFALTTTQVGSNSIIPAPYVAEPERPELDGTISPSWCTSMVNADVGAKVPCGKPYPTNGDVDPLRWQADADPQSGGGKVFLPYLPPVANSYAFAGGFAMPASTCRVYFPGRYTDDVVITGSTPVYFVSGVYYFEKSVYLSGDATVVVGSGSAEGCVDSDAEAVADALNAPLDAYSNGVGGTWVFGANGRLVIDNAVAGSGAGVSLQFNRRLVAATDAAAIMNEVSIMSVTGVISGSDTVGLDIPGRLNVPETLVYVSETTQSDALSNFYRASNLVSAAAVPAPCPPPPAAATVGCPIIDINLTTAAKVTVKIPGYVSVPQGSLSVAVAPAANVNKSISFGGGILAAQMSVSALAPDYLQLGLLNPVVQYTFKIVTTTTGSGPQVTSVAQVQVNETGGYAINSWVIQAVS